MDRQKAVKKQKKRQPYEAPRLTKYGSLPELTQNVSMGMFGDSGTGSSNMMMGAVCLTSLSALEEHRLLLQDKACQQRFRQAIREAVRPGDVVLDLGTGSGIHALFACEAGAARVYAVDSENVIEVARETVAQNGYKDRVHFIYGMSHAVELPEKVDVIITNIGFVATLRFLPDCVARFLKKGGRLVPSSVRLSFVPIECDDFYEKNIQSWRKKRFGFRFDAFLPYAMNYPHYVHFHRNQYLAKPRQALSLDLTRPLSAKYEGQCGYRAGRDGVVHGFLGWYAFQLGNGVALSTEPPLRYARELWAQPFLPLERPLRVKKGERIGFDVSFYLRAHPVNPVWRWAIQVGAISTEQDTFHGMPLAPEFLAKLRHTGHRLVNKGGTVAASLGA